MRAPSKTVERARRLRREMTHPEVVLWSRLRRGSLDGFRFRRQHPAGPCVLDFYCAQARLAIEVGGAAQDVPARAAADAIRTAWLAEHGIAILRLPARDVLRADEAEHVISMSMAACVERSIDAPRPLHRASRGPPPPLRG